MQCWKLCCSDEQPGHPLMNIKVLILGDAQTGKKSLAKCYFKKTTDSFSNGFKRFLVHKSSNVTINFWYSKINNLNNESLDDYLKQMLKDVKFILYTFDLTSIKTINSIKKWYKKTIEIQKVKN